MKLVTFIDAKSNIKTGVWENDTVLDLAAASRVHDKKNETMFSSMISILENMPTSIGIAKKLEDAVRGKGPAKLMLPASKIKLLAPVPRPASIRDCMVFAGHLANAMHTIAGWRMPPVKWLNSITGKKLLRPSGLFYKIPAYYKGNPASVIGPGEDIIWPSYSEKLDYELEYGIFICRKGKNIPVRDAGDYIGGYTIFNDVSARDAQLREMNLRLGPAKGKDFDTGNVMGPWLVTRDGLNDPYNLNMNARINGETWSVGNSRDMSFTFEEIIAYISKDETLYPGDFIGSGTVPTGCGLELDRWIKPGDIIELEVEGLGTLSNKIVKT